MHDIPRRLSIRSRSKPPTPIRAPASATPVNEPISIKFTQTTASLFTRLAPFDETSRINHRLTAIELHIKILLSELKRNQTVHSKIVELLQTAKNKIQVGVQACVDGDEAVKASWKGLGEVDKDVKDMEGTAHELAGMMNELRIELGQLEGVREEIRAKMAKGVEDAGVAIEDDEREDGEIEE